MAWRRDRSGYHPYVSDPPHYWLQILRIALDVFPISPSGGRPSAASHVSQRIANPEQLHPLSTIVHAIVRLRPRRAFADVEEEDLPHASAIQTPGVFTFLKYRQHPLEKGMFCDDMVIFRSSVAEVELARLSVRQINRSKISSTDGVSTQRRASALTEMIRSRAGLTEPNDLSVTGAIRARWCLPLGSNTESPILLISRSKQWKALAVDPQRSR